MTTSRLGAEYHGNAYQYMGARKRHDDVRRLLGIEGFEQPDAKILDIGSGSLRETLHLADTALRLVAVDRSADMLNLIPKRENILPLCLDANGALPFPDESFTHALMISSLHHISARGELFGEVARVLLPNGKLLIVTSEPEIVAARSMYSYFQGLATNASRRFLPLSDLTEELRSAGFKTKVERMKRDPQPFTIQDIEKIRTRIFDSAFFLIDDECWSAGLTALERDLARGATIWHVRDRVALCASKIR